MAYGINSFSKRIPFPSANTSQFGVMASDIHFISNVNIQIHQKNPDCRLAIVYTVQSIEQL